LGARLNSANPLRGLEMALRLRFPCLLLLNFSKFVILAEQTCRRTRKLNPFRNPKLLLPRFWRAATPAVGHAARMCWSSRSRWRFACAAEVLQSPCAPPERITNWRLGFC